ncbi:hypothetical protein POL74_17585, partial [Clostridioides difficile]|nr:hypothetical protein [Clostridioides difficile]
MYNKKVISILLSTVIASSTSLNITLSNINVFADKPTYKNNLQSENENISLHMGEYKDDNGILSFQGAEGKLKEATYLRFDFNRNAYNDVTVLYTLNSQEESITGKNIKIPIKNQTELDEVLKSLKINTNGNKKLGFNVSLGGLPIFKSVEGKPSRLYKAERAIDGNNDTFYGAINQNNSTFTILFKDKTYIENILIKANKNFTIEGLKDNVWKTIGDSTTDSIEINGKKKINVEKDIYDGIIIKQKHSGVDSCTINEIEFNNGSVEEKINYNSNVCSLDLGNKVVNEDGSISFKDFNAKGNEVKLLINFEKDSDKNKVSYIQNKQTIEKQGNCEIDINDETEFNEILENIKIYHDNKTENNVNISLITNNNNSIENVPERIIAEGGASDSVHTAENVFSGSNSFFISNSSNTLTLKNTKDIYLNGVAFLNGNSQIIIKGLKNGKWSDIGTHNSNEFEMIDLKSGYYDEVKFTSSSTLDIRSLYLRYSDIKEDIKLGIKEEVADKIDMGKIEYSNGKITFKDATGRIQDKANISISSKTNIEINYTLNGEEITKDGKEIIVEDLTQETLDEFLRNFSISYNEYEGCELDISLLGNLSTIIQTQNYSIPQIQGDLELNLGDYENDGDGNVVFPTAKGLLYRKGNLNINFETGFSDDIEIKYKLNNTEYTKKQNNLSIPVSNQHELDEVLNTLKIKCDSNLEYNLNVTLAEERYIPLGTTSDKPEALTGGWYSGRSSTATINFKSPLKMSAVSLTKTSGVDNCFYIKGSKNGIWKEIGRFTTVYPNYDYLKTREIDVQRDSYDAISITYTVANGWGSSNVSKLGFLDKVSSDIKIKPDINLKVTLEDNLEKANLKWNSDLEAYAYNIYVKKKEDANWYLCKSVTSNINKTDDYNIKDSAAPLVPKHEIQSEGVKKGIQLESDDLGTEYSYYINAIDKDGNRIGTSNVENINVQSDFKEFIYEVNNSSTTPTELKNKSNGFIPFRELIDENYLHVASIDNTGNISNVKTIPILGLFVDKPPVINVPGDSSLKVNSKIDINEGVSATDEIDGDLTSK